MMRPSRFFFLVGYVFRNSIINPLLARILRLGKNFLTCPTFPALTGPPDHPHQLKVFTLRRSLLSRPSWPL